MSALPDRFYFGGKWHYDIEDTSDLDVIENALYRAKVDLKRYATTAPHPLTMTPAAIDDALARVDSWKQRVTQPELASKEIEDCYWRVLGTLQDIVARAEVAARKRGKTQ